MLINAKIDNIGLYFNGRYNHACVQIELQTRGGGASIQFPIEKTVEFMSMFKDELDLENGVFVHELKGVPVRLKTDGNEFGKRKIIAIGDILSNEDEMMEL